MSTPEPPPNHYTSADDDAGTWTCTCGEGGRASNRQDASDLAWAHRDMQSDLVARTMTPAQFAEALRIGAANDTQRQAAIGLIIANEWWLEQESLRPYVFCRWEHLGSMAAFIDWRQLTEALLVTDRAIKVLRAVRAPEIPVDEIDEWDTRQAEIRRAQDKAIDGSSSELAILRIAASIAASMPISICDDTRNLDNDNRGLVLTAIGHLLNHGGNVPFWSALTWDQHQTGELH